MTNLLAGYRSGNCSMYQLPKTKPEVGNFFENVLKKIPGAGSGYSNYY